MMPTRDPLQVKRHTQTESKGMEKIFHDGHREYCGQWSKSDREKRMPYYFIYMWNLKNKINKLTKETNSQIQRTF